MKITLSFSPERLQQIKEAIRGELAKRLDAIHWFGESDYDVCIDTSIPGEITVVLYHCLAFDGGIDTLTEKWHVLTLEEVNSDEQMILRPLTFNYNQHKAERGLNGH